MGGCRQPKPTPPGRGEAEDHPIHRHIGRFGGGIDHHDVPVHEPAGQDGVQDALEHFFGAIGNLFDALGDVPDRDSD